MKKIIFIFLMFLLALAALPTYAQTEYGTGAIPLTEAELAKIPELQLSIESATTPLPDSATNNWRIYFPPEVFHQGQVGCCAQAATIGHMFTYEMNRLRGVAT